MTERDEFIRRLTDAGFGEVEAGRLFDNDAEVHAIRAALADADRERENLRADLATAERERDRYRVALAQYADAKSWMIRDYDGANCDYIGEGEGPELALWVLGNKADATDWRFLHGELAATQRRDRERLESATDALRRIYDSRGDAGIGDLQQIAFEGLCDIKSEDK